MSTNRTVSNLNRFLSDWADLRAATTPAHRLRAFLEQAKPLLTAAREPTTSPQLNLSVDRFRTTLATLAEPLAAARRRGDALDIWEVAGLARDEVRTARVLTWLLDPNGSHGGSDAYLQALWTAVDGAQALGFELQSPRSAVRENYPLGDVESRVDVEVLGENFLLFIEVKIDAAEGPDQISRYCSLAARKAAVLGKPNWAVLYLAQKKPQLLAGRCLHLRWRTVQQSIETAARTMKSNDFSTRVALQFAKHVARLH